MFSASMNTILTNIHHSNCMHMHTHTYTHRHLVEAGIWKTRQLAGPTIQQALTQWYSNQTVPMHFRDNCVGLHCNNQCPDRFSFGELDSNDWSPVAKAVSVGLVLGVTILCLVAKGIFYIWMCCLQRKQNMWLCCLQWKQHHCHGVKAEKKQASSYVTAVWQLCHNLYSRHKSIDSRVSMTKG